MRSLIIAFPDEAHAAAMRTIEEEGRDGKILVQIGSFQAEIETEGLLRKQLAEVE